MDFELTEEERAIRDTAREFAGRELLANAAHWDEASIFPVETLSRAAAA
jgi:hypothetical protein